MSESTPHTPTQLPIWLSLLIILLCLGGGGWFLWNTFMASDVRVSRVDVDPNAPPNSESPRAGDGARGGGGPPPGMRRDGGPRPYRGQGSEAIALLRDRAWSVRAGSVYLRLNRDRGGTWYPSISFADYRFLPEGQRDLLAIRRYVIEYNHIQQRLGTTPEQVDALKAMGDGGRLALLPDEQALLLSRWNAVVAASEAGHEAAAQAMLDELRRVGGEAIQRIQPEAVARVTEIARILSAEQITAYREMQREGFRRPSTTGPATAPVPAPATAPATR